MARSPKTNNPMFVIFRLFIGGLFIFSGVEKLLSPYQNFLYVVQAYELFPPFLELVVARTVPWIEVFVGLFLVLGLWTSYALKAALLLFAGFIVIVGQALLRKLPIEECGCFGDFSLPPMVVLVMDSGFVLMTAWLILNLAKTTRFSLDAYFAKNGG